MKKRAAVAIAWMVLAGPLAGQSLAGSGDPDAIRHLLMATFDKPENPLAVDPVSVEGDIAVAGWAQGEMGGRALLRRKDGAWSIVLCSGDALKSATALAHMGLTQPEAAALAAAVTAAEAGLDPDLVAKFSRFDGIVMMDESGHHPPVDAHGAVHHTD